MVRSKALRIPLRHHGRVRYCGDFYGEGAVGAVALAGIIGALPEGPTELCCHPAAAVDPAWDYAHERRTESAAAVGLQNVHVGEIDERRAVGRGAAEADLFGAVVQADDAGGLVDQTILRRP